MKIYYSETAIKSLNVILEFLESKWTIKQINLLNSEILKFEETISENLITHQSISTDSNVKYMLVAKKQVKIYYTKFNNDEVRVLAFWYSKGNPQQLKKLLR